MRVVWRILLAEEDIDPGRGYAVRMLRIQFGSACCSLGPYSRVPRFGEGGFQYGDPEFPLVHTTSIV
jgi:hypothetical protein